ncbi:MAG: arsenic resistance protein [Thermodesulfobacteriota bacterium]
MLKILEEKQISIYALAIIAGAALGLFIPDAGQSTEILIEPVLAVLLYGMFVQIPFFQLRSALGNSRFMTALFVLNFVLVPILVWLLIRFLPDQTPLLLGVCLVLLTPCIDYVIVFTHLGRGDAKLILAATPVLLIAQMLLLPLYLWGFLGSTALALMSAKPFLVAFLILIACPLTLAVASEFWAKKWTTGKVWLNFTAWIPVPMMALVLFIIIASQIEKVHSYLSLITWAIPIYITYILMVLFLGRLTASLFGLKRHEARTLIFSGGTRNSLVVLPLALALPGELRYPVAAVIVTQTIMELVAELFYIRVIPTLIVPDAIKGNKNAREKL